MKREVVNATQQTNLNDMVLETDVFLFLSGAVLNVEDTD